VFPFSLIFYSLFAGFKSFGKILKISTIEHILNIFLAIVLVVYLGSGVAGIILAKFLSLVAMLGISLYYYRRLPFTDQKIDVIAVKRYCKNTTIVIFANKAKVQTLLVYMALFIAQKNLGFYYIVEKISKYIIEIPMNAISEVLLPFASDIANDKKKLGKFISLNLKLTLIMGVIFGLALVFFGGPVLIYIFPAYADGYYLIPFFALFLLGTIMIKPIAIAYRSINRMDVVARMNSFNVPLTISIGYFLVLNYGLIGLLTTQIISNVVGFLYIYSKSKSVDLEIELIPRKKDIVLFYNAFKMVFLNKKYWGKK